MRLGLKTLTLALVVTLLAVPAAFAKGPGGKGGPPAWAGGGGGKGKGGPPPWAGAGKDHGKPAWAGQGRGHGKADKRGKAQDDEVDVQQEEEPRHDNPAWVCKFERDMSGDEPFAEKYGTNVNKANAFGMCVSQEAHERDGAEEIEEAEAECPTAEEASEEGALEDSAADSGETGGEAALTGEESEEEGFESSQECEPAEEEAAEEEAASEEEELEEEGLEEEELEANLLEGLNPAQFCFVKAVELGDDFATTYGTNVNLANAFGKCVSQRSEELESESEAGDEEAPSTQGEGADEDADADDPAEDEESDEEEDEGEEPEEDEDGAEDTGGLDLSRIYAFLRL